MQQANEFLASIDVSDKQIAQNTEPEEEEKKSDPVFDVLSKFVEQNRSISVPQAFVDAQKNNDESQYGRFAGRLQSNQTNWGLKR